MRTTLATVPGHSHDQSRIRVQGMYAVLLAFNLGVWIGAAIALHRYPVLLGTALLAYSFGLRHAVDADHLAAIDNVIRKMMQEGRKPVAVGFMFSLGHSTVVIVVSAAIVLAATALQQRMGTLKEIGNIIGAGVSASFLFAIALMNLIVLRSVYHVFVRVRAGETCAYRDDLDLLLNNRGLLARLYRPMFRLITRSWHMYPLGLLFGLGFDTATEIGVLGISAAEASKGLPLGSIMLFPMLFTAGMALVDTTDGIVMLGAYGWAFAKPIRKLYYNMTITFASVVVAVVVGGLELLGLVADSLHLGGPFWDAIGTLNDHFGTVGYVIIGLFLLCWGTAVVIYKWRRFDDLA